MNNNEPETTNDYTVNPQTNTKQNKIALANKAEDSASIKSPKTCRQHPDAKQMNTMIQIFKHDMAK